MDIDELNWTEFLLLLKRIAESLERIVKEEYEIEVLDPGKRYKYVKDDIELIPKRELAGYKLVEADEKDPYTELLDNNRRELPEWKLNEVDEPQEYFGHMAAALKDDGKRTLVGKFKLKEEDEE